MRPILTIWYEMVSGRHATRLYFGEQIGAADHIAFVVVELQNSYIDQPHGQETIGAVRPGQTPSVLDSNGFG